MDRLKGKTILIGKEPGQGRLFVSVLVNGQAKTTAIGQPGCVPNSVSRCKPAEGTAHCKIEVGLEGNMTLTNLKPQNTTFVNGTEVMSKRITETSVVALGKDKYAIDLRAVLNAAVKIVQASAGGTGGGGVQPPMPEHSIRHLKKVWDDYNARMKEIKVRQKNVGLLSSIPMAFSMLGGLLAGVAPEIRGFALVFTGIALVVMIIGLYKRFKDKSMEEIEQLTDEFQSNYVCPNSQCRHFMGNQPYKILRQNKKCPYCGCLLTEE